MACATCLDGGKVGTEHGAPGVRNCDSFHHWSKGAPRPAAFLMAFHCAKAWADWCASDLAETWRTYDCNRRVCLKSMACLNETPWNLGCSSPALAGLMGLCPGWDGALTKVWDALPKARLDGLHARFLAAWASMEDQSSRNWESKQPTVGRSWGPSKGNCLGQGNGIGGIQTVRGISEAQCQKWASKTEWSAHIESSTWTWVKSCCNSGERKRKSFRAKGKPPTSNMICSPQW